MLFSSDTCEACIGRKASFGALYKYAAVLIELLANSLLLRYLVFFVHCYISKHAPEYPCQCLRGIRVCYRGFSSPRRQRKCGSRCERSAGRLWPRIAEHRSGKSLYVTLRSTRLPDHPSLTIVASGVVWVEGKSACPAAQVLGRLTGSPCNQEFKLNGYSYHFTNCNSKNEPGSVVYKGKKLFDCKTQHDKVSSQWIL